MRAVWSFWSEPFRGRRSGWDSGLHHLLSWVLSVETARLHFPRTALHTDDAGARELVDAVGLNFDAVSTDLNELIDRDPDWWALGKLATYARQDEPFIHIDSDVYLWSPPPDRLAEAGVFAQNPEGFTAHDLCYGLEEFRGRVAATGGWLPVEAAAYVPRDGVPRGACCGIFGGRRTDFIGHYARQAIRVADALTSGPAWATWPDRTALNVMVEQHLLVACLDYHAGRPDSPFAGIGIEYLFTDFGDALRRAPETGFTHLLGSGAKRDADVLRRLEARVRRDYPDHYERCVRYWSDSRGGRPSLVPAGGGVA